MHLYGSSLLIHIFPSYSDKKNPNFPLENYSPTEEPTSRSWIHRGLVNHDWFWTDLIQATHFESAWSVPLNHGHTDALMTLELLQEELCLVLPELSLPPHRKPLRKGGRTREGEKTDTNALISSWQGLKQALQPLKISCKTL